MKRTQLLAQTQTRCEIQIGILPMAKKFAIFEELRNLTIAQLVAQSKVAQSNYISI